MSDELHTHMREDAQEHGENHDHDHGHEHDHEHGHDHDHEHDHEHGHDHSHSHDHGHGHDHGHEHHHSHEHGHCGCDHDCENIPEHELSAKPSFSYHVVDIDCPNCALGVQNAVRMLPCVSDARLVYATGTLEVVVDKKTPINDCKRQVLACVRSCGSDLELSAEESELLDANRPWIIEHREQILMGISGVALLLGLIAEFVLHNTNASTALYVVSALSGLAFIAPMAWAAVGRGTADMNVLMGIAVIGGLILGFLGDQEVFRDAAIVIFLDQVGEWLEGWSMRKTAGSIRELMKLTPDDAHVVDERGTTSDVDVKEIEEGEVIRILPGERVPLDGVIVKGTSSFNEAPVTGESIPRDKGVGQQVFAGSLNTSLAVDVQVTACEDETTLARIISLVQGAQAEKAPYESFVNRFAAVYTPIVIVGALIVGVVVPLLISLISGFSPTVWHDWVYRALSLLVVACPCALVISTPVTFVSALTRAAKNGALVKGGAYFDIATRVTSIAFDKTGTLTTGRPRVVHVAPFNGASERDVLQIAYTLESASTHPLARSVVDEAQTRGIHPAVADEIEEIASHGMIARVQGVRYVVGKLAFAQRYAHVDNAVINEVRRMGEEGATALVVCGGGQVAGVIGVADTLRSTTATAIDELHDLGIAETIMLTGDNEQTAASIAAQAGVSSYAFELLPNEKAEHIRTLQNASRTVAMVGDGINDAPALASADLGITMGAAASDTALEVADVALLSDDLGKLPQFFWLANKTMRVVRENIVFALGVKLLVFVLVIAGVAGMGAAVFADTGVALLVVLNGMRLMVDSRLPF